MHPSNRASRRKSSLAPMRPTDDIRSFMRVEAASIEPLEEAKRIDEGPSSAVSCASKPQVLNHSKKPRGLTKMNYLIRRRHSQAPNNQGNVGSVSNVGNLGLSFGLGGLFVGSTDLSPTDHPLLGNTTTRLQKFSTMTIP
jgi:hypothetical protein